MAALKVVYDPPLKNCKDCLDEFGFCHRPAPYQGPRCRTHALARRNAARRSAHQSHVEKTYNLPAGHYDKLKEFQGGRCAICKRATGKTRNLAVDHDHKHCDDCKGTTSCGKGVRGLLCNLCNQILGRVIRDNPQIALAIYEYLTDPPYQKMILVEEREQRLADLGVDVTGMRPGDLVFPSNVWDGMHYREQFPGDEFIGEVDQ